MKYLLGLLAALLAVAAIAQQDMDFNTVTITPDYVRRFVVLSETNQFGCLELWDGIFLDATICNLTVGTAAYTGINQSAPTLWESDGATTIPIMEVYEPTFDLYATPGYLQEWLPTTDTMHIYTMGNVKYETFSGVNYGAVGAGLASLNVGLATEGQLNVYGTLQVNGNGTYAADIDDKVTINSPGILAGDRLSMYCDPTGVVTTSHFCWMGPVQMSTGHGVSLVRAGSFLGVAGTCDVTIYVSSGTMRMELYKNAAVVLTCDKVYSAAGTPTSFTPCTQARNVDTFAAADRWEVAFTQVSGNATLSNCFATVDIIYDN